MRKKEIIKRYILFILSLFVIGIGIALTKRGEMGISPVSSVPNVVSIRFPFLSFGTWLTISNCVFILGQIVLLRKKFQPFQLLQIPLSFLFGYFTDFGLYLAKFLPDGGYIFRLMFVFFGIIVIGLGITLGVIANVILNSAEAFVKALSDVTCKEFSNVKVVFDVVWVTFSIVLSLIFFKGSLVGTREGTIISAVFTGFAVKFWLKFLKKPINKILSA